MARYRLVKLGIFVTWLLASNIPIAFSAEVQSYSRYEKVHCINPIESNRHKEIIFIKVREKKFNFHLLSQDQQGQIRWERLRDVHFQVLTGNAALFSGADVVERYLMQELNGPAVKASVSLINPYYHSDNWLCKSFGQS